MISSYWRICGAVLLLALPNAFAMGQGQQSAADMDDDAIVAADDLPDAPSERLGKSKIESIFGTTQRGGTGDSAKKFHRVVEPNQFVLPLTGKEKMELSVKSRLTVSSFASTFFATGWSHLRDGPPHYGTDKGAFGERLGALAIKQTTQSFFSYGVYPTLFHDDPRYYVMGRGEKVSTRALYSASCTLITQKDDGGTATNWPKLAGIASATALTNAYYPPADRGFTNNAKSFVFSLGTSVLTDEIHEFIGDGIRLIRRHKNE